MQVPLLSPVELAKSSCEMLHPYFDFWANFWRGVAAAEPEKGGSVAFIVQFGDVERVLEDVHPDTGLPVLIAPFKRRIEEILSGRDVRGLSIVFRVDPRRGLVHTVRGDSSAVASAARALSLQSRQS